MAKPLARVLTLLDILQAGGTRTLRELAERLGVDERTVRRYVDHLLDLGVPVESVRGRYGGYRLVPGYRMPPLMLTDDEALAVILGLNGARRAALNPGAAAAVESAAAKVRRVLPRAIAARLGTLVATSYTDSRGPVTPETGILLAFAGAAVERRPLAITYSGRNGRVTERVLQPYGVVAHRGRWYATGLDSRSSEVRSFRLDRVAHVAVQDGQFQVPAGFDPAAVVTEAVAGASYPHAISVRIHGGEQAVRMRMRMPGPIAVIEPAAGEPGWVRVRWRAERLDWVPSVLAGLGLPFVIEEPDELRDRVRALAGQLTSWAGRALREPSARHAPRPLPHACRLHHARNPVPLFDAYANPRELHLMGDVCPFWPVSRLSR